MILLIILIHKSIYLTIYLTIYQIILDLSNPLPIYLELLFGKKSLPGESLPITTARKYQKQLQNSLEGKKILF